MDLERTGWRRMSGGRLQASLTDRYVLEREVGRGGMATVYLARDLKHDRPAFPRESP